jgi:hypothetical protein
MRRSRNWRHNRGRIRKDKKGDVLHRKGRGGWTRAERTGLIKGDIPRNAHPTSNRVPTLIALVLMTVSKKDTLNRLSCQLGAFAWSKEDIANATK